MTAIRLNFPKTIGSHTYHLLMDRTSRYGIWFPVFGRRVKTYIGAMWKALASAVTALLVATPVAAQDCVVLLHGLARTDTSMRVMEAALARAGYTTVNRSYPSTELAFDALVDRAVPPSVAPCGDARVHFVTH